MLARVDGDDLVLDQLRDFLQISDFEAFWQKHAHAFQSIEAQITSYVQAGWAGEDKEWVLYLFFHQVGHSFVNPLAERYSVVVQQYEQLYPPLQEAMRPWGYVNWTIAKTSMCCGLRIAVFVGDSWPFFIRYCSRLLIHFLRQAS